MHGDIGQESGYLWRRVINRRKHKGVFEGTGNALHLDLNSGPIGIFSL